MYGSILQGREVLLIKEQKMKYHLLNKWCPAGYSCMEKPGKEVEIRRGIFHARKEEKVFCVYKSKSAICWLNNDHGFGCVSAAFISGCLIK